MAFTKTTFSSDQNLTTTDSVQFDTLSVGGPYVARGIANFKWTGAGEDGALEWFELGTSTTNPIAQYLPYSSQDHEWIYGGFWDGSSYVATTTTGGMMTLVNGKWTFQTWTGATPGGSTTELTCLSMAPDGTTTLATTNLNGSVSIATGGTRTVTVGSASSTLHLASPVRSVLPAGLFARESGGYTTTTSATAGLRLAIGLTEMADLTSSWAVNQGGAGRWQYQGSLSRYFVTNVSFSVSTSSGGASTLTIQLQYSANGSTAWTTIGETDRYLSGTSDTGSGSLQGYYDTPANYYYRILLTSTNASARYTFNHLQIHAQQML